MTTGTKTGGRKKGTPNKVTATARPPGEAADVPGLFPPIKRDSQFPAYRLARVETLQPYRNNARTHSPAQIDLIARLITEYGFTNPVLVDGKRGIVAGHGRVLAARKLGLDVVPTIELSHLTAQQRRAYVLADNASALQAGWDDELLRLELGELRDEGFDLSLTGFETGDLDKLFDDVEPPDDFGAYDENIETEHQCPKCGYRFSGGSSTGSIEGEAAAPDDLEV